MGLISNGDLDAAQLVTHHFELGDIENADDVFENAGESGALKVVLAA